MVQGLTVCAPSAEGPGSIPGLGTRATTKRSNATTRDSTCHIQGPAQPNKYIFLKDIWSSTLTLYLRMWPCWKQGCVGIISQDEVMEGGPFPVWLCPYKKRTETHRERSDDMWQWRQRSEWCSCKPRTADHHPKPERGNDGFYPVSRRYGHADTLISRTLKEALPTVLGYQLWLPRWH